jgi:hypothetical protein
MSEENRSALLGFAILLCGVAAVLLLVGLWVSGLTVTQKLLVTGGAAALLGAGAVWAAQR